MLRRILRASIPILLLAAGIVSVGYGVWGHVVTVVEKPAAPEETAAADDVPPPPSPDPWMSGPPQGDPWMSGPPSDPWMNPPAEEEEPGPDEEAAAHAEQHETAPPPPEKQITHEPETAIVLEVTRGGVSRSLSGEIARTYSMAAGERPASLCPT